MTNSTERTWSLGFTLLLVAPFVGLATVLIDLPLWADITAVVLVIALVFVGTRLMYRQRGGWRPSATLPPKSDDDD